MPGQQSAFQPPAYCIKESKFANMIFGKPERPAVCESLQSSTEMCGETRGYAMHYLRRLDELTS